MIKKATNKIKQFLLITIFGPKIIFPQQPLKSSIILADSSCEGFYQDKCKDFIPFPGQP